MFGSPLQMKMVFMHGVLETYEELIGRMLSQLPTATPPLASSGTTSNHDSGGGAQVKADVRSKLTYVLGKIQYLKRHRYQEQEKLLLSLQSLKSIQVCGSVLGDA